VHATMALHTTSWRGRSKLRARNQDSSSDRDQRLDTEIRGSNKINKYEEKTGMCKLLIYIKRYHLSQSLSFF